MCSTLSHADSILKEIQNGRPYNESIKQILKTALKKSTSELRIDSELAIFELKDAKELLIAYLENENFTFSLSLNAEFILLENEKYRELFDTYIERRELDDESQISACAFGFGITKELILLYHKKRGLCPKALAAAKDRKWL